MNKGMVYLVGAGPGDPGLLTLKGKALLETAEALVYDRLASREFLALVPETCEKFYVGKEPGRHSMPQEEINRLLTDLALKGKRVVRLKGGDPFVFGRGGEEIQELSARGIPYEVVSGVTSAIAAPAWAGIPVTHRGVGQSFHVITGHTAAGRGTDFLTDGFPLYAKLSGTLVFLMGLSSLEAIVENLIRYGKDPKTPAAVVTDGTLPKGRVVRAALSKLPEAVKEAGLKSPGVIVVGPTAAFSMTSRDRLPLSGVSVGLTGTDLICEKLKKKLEEQGASVCRAAVSRVVKEDPAGLLKALDRLSEISWIVFTSSNGVRLFFDALEKRQTDFRRLGHVKFAVVGRGTGEALKARGFYADCMPETYTTKALALALIKAAEPGETILFPRAKGGSPELSALVSGAGYRVLDVPVYDIKTEPVGKEDLLGLKDLHYITFESGSGVRGFFEGLEEEKRELLETGPRAVCIGQVTAEALKSFGVRRILTARDYTAEGILSAVMEDRDRGTVRL